MTRTGKIARLPREVREALNRRLRDGEPGKGLVGWLNAKPEVRARLQAEFGGRAISEQNLSEWKQGGYREWRAHQDALAHAGELAASAGELNAAASTMTDHLATVLTARYTAALGEWDGDPEGGIGRKLRVLRALCQDVVELRRGDHSAARLKIEQVRLDREGGGDGGRVGGPLRAVGQEPEGAGVDLRRMPQPGGTGAPPPANLRSAGRPSGGAAQARTSAGCGAGIRRRRGIKPNPTRSNPGGLSAMILPGLFPADDPKRVGRTKPAEEGNNPHSHPPFAPGFRGKWGVDPIVEHPIPRVPVRA